MKRSRFANVGRTLVACLLSMAGAVGCAAPDTWAAPAELKLENLLKVSLADEFTPDREIVVSLVEIPPGMEMDRHWHPGEEFHYYLEGSVEIQIDGAPSIMGKPGSVGHVPYEKKHTAIAGPKGAKALVFRVHTEGEPVRYLEEGGSAKE